ncbi:MAG: hypothetical protein P8X96_25960 [Desulfobacteraceae bacterium]
MADTGPAGEIDSGFKGKFLETVNNDLNIPQALAVVQELLKSALDPSVKLATVIDFDQVLGLDLGQLGGAQKLPDEIQALVDARARARRDKKWALSDQLRDEIQAKGYVVQDSAQGMKVFKA